MKFIFTLISFCFVMHASAQRCGSSEYLLQHSSSRFLETAKAPSAKDARDTLPDEVIVIPVVVHVLYNNNTENISDQQVLSQIEVLNQDYRRLNQDAVNTPAPFKNIAADTRIIFCLSKVDPQGNYTSGIVRKFTKEPKFLADDAMKFSSSGGDDAWDATKYLNIWVCNLFGRTLGYAVLPGSALNKDGVVIKYNVFGTTGLATTPFNKGRTATHEVGHWLGLRHLWGDDNCGDDGIADTPPQQTGNNYCTSFPHLSSCSINEYGDMFMNYMDFNDDACMNLFTQGQKSAMRSLFARGNSKNSFLDAPVCDSSNAQGGPLPPVEGIADRPLITAYPNPFINEITISSKNAGDVIGKVWKLYSATGRLYSSQILHSQKTTIHVNNLPAGIYFLQIEGNDKSFVYKLIKQFIGK